MSDSNDDWKEPHRKAIQRSIDFFGCEGKFARESWVVRQLLVAIDVSFVDGDLSLGEEPVDVLFREARFQIKELMDSGRRRHISTRSILLFT